MTVRPIRWIVPAAACLALLACDRGRDGPDQPIPGNAAAPARTNAPESIIREDVLAETEAPNESPQVEPAEVTLDFAEAGGEVPAAARSELDALLKQPAITQGGCIIIRGHTDSRGSDEQNLRMSEQRAAMVGDYLVDQGVDRDRLVVIALGERRPVAPNANPDGSDYPEGRARNRRVTVEALPPGAADAPCKLGESPESPSD